MIALLIPSAVDLIGWAGVAFAALVFVGLGRLVSNGRAAPEIALVAGWGAAALVLTLWGVATPLSMRFPAWILAALGLAGLAAPRSRLAWGEWRGIGRLLLLALPLLAVMASARPSQPDTFLNLLPNAAYLADHGFFPADGRALSYSELPGAPYNLQLAALVAALVTPGFPANAMIGFNLVLQLAAGLLLARLVARSEDDPGAVPSWGAMALGVLLATAFNPGFVPRYDLSNYSEPSVTVALAFAGFLAARRAGPAATGLLALTLAALISIKQDSFALALGVAATAALLPTGKGETRRDLALAVLPAALLYLAWRWYVLSHFGENGELKLAPLADWQFDALPLILWHVLGTIAEKIFFFGTLFAAILYFLARLRRGPVDWGASPEMRVAAILTGTTLVYNAALLAAYIAHFPSEMAADAHSFFRYNTHLSLLLMVAITWLARDWVGAHVAALSARWRRLLPAAMIAVLLACPPAFLNFLRFDLEIPQQRAWLLAKETASRVADGDRLLLILPGDNASLSAMLEGVLRLTPPRRNDLQIGVTRDFAPGALGLIAGQENRWALLSCAPAGVDGVPEGQAALFRRDDAGWHVAALIAYPPAVPDRWSRVVSTAPLCLGS